MQAIARLFRDAAWPVRWVGGRLHGTAEAEAVVENVIHRCGLFTGAERRGRPTTAALSAWP